MRRFEAKFYFEVELRTPQSMREVLRLLHVLHVLRRLRWAVREESLLCRIKVGVETKRAEMSVIKRQGIAVLTEVSRVLVDGRNALDIRAAVAQRVAQRPCCTTVSDESRPKAGGGNTNNRVFVTGSAGFPRMNRDRKILSWKPRVPAREGLIPTFDWVTERTAGLS